MSNCRCLEGMCTPSVQAYCPRHKFPARVQERHRTCCAELENGTAEHQAVTQQPVLLQVTIEILQSNKVTQTHDPLSLTTLIK